MDRRPRPDSGSPARLIATMVGIVGIMLLGSLAWSAVGTLFSAVGDATGSLNGARATPIRLTASAVTPRPTDGPTPRPGAAQPATPTPAAAPAASASPIPTIASTPTPAPVAPSPTPAPTTLADGRAPWILLPQPAPGGRVAPGATTIEARGRGDAKIASMRLELDGAALPVTLEQRSDSIWRASATAQVSAGQHAVRATVIDDLGRSGGFRWTFEAGP